MKISKPICITFAGAIGSSKTPITNYLSTKLNLPVFNNDAIRSEILEDFGKFDSKEHMNRRDKMLGKIVKSKISFICDVSVDREWEMFNDILIKNNYRWFIISLDLSKKLLSKLYKIKGYNESLAKIDQVFLDHENFVNKYAGEIGLRITDKNFKKRCEISYKATIKLV